MALMHFFSVLLKNGKTLSLAMGTQSKALQKALAALFFAALFQGLALSCLYLIIQGFALSVSIPLMPCIIMTATSIAALTLRWYGQGFEYNGHLAQATYELRTKLGAKLRNISLETLQQTRTGEMSTVLLSNIDEHFNYIIAIANITFSSIVTPFTVAVATYAVSGRLSLALLLIFPLVVILHRWQYPMIRQHIALLTQHNKVLNGDIIEFIQGSDTLRFCGKEEERFATLRTQCNAFKRLQQSLHRKGSTVTLLTACAIELYMLALLFISVIWVISGTIDIAALIAAMVILTRFAEPMSTFISHTAVIEMIAGTLGHIQQLFDTPSLPIIRSDKTVPQHYEVTFDAVTFRYTHSDKDTLHALSLTFESNCINALIGTSGAGKSTIAKLIQRYADPQHGRICIGGVDIRTLPAEQLSRYISVVFQDVVLFDDTLLANLQIAKPEASMEEIRHAAQQAQCLTFIERLPQGWHTRIEASGVTLSGGERQRLSIARALLKDTPIVILDEPTASLDMESEDAIKHALEHLVKNRTIILITHRPATLKAADKLYVLEGGHLAAKGTPQELMDAHSPYRALWDAETTSR